MNGRQRDGRAIREPGARVRDSKGRWVRRAAPAAGRGADEFVFDDRVLEGTSSPEEAAPPLELEDLGDVVTAAPAGDSWDGVWALPAEEEPPPAAFSRPNAGSLPPALWLVGVVVVVSGALAFAVHRGWSGPEALARWAAPSGSATASETPREGVLVADRSTAPVDRVVIPPVPPPLAPRPRTPAAAGRSETLADPPAPGPQAAPKPPPDAGAIAVVPDAAAPGEPAAPPTLLASGDREEENGWFKLADEYLQVGDGARAEELLRHIHDSGRQRGRAALALGDLLSARGDFQQASEFYRESTRLFQDAAEQPPAR